MSESAIIRFSKIKPLTIFKVDDIIDEDAISIKICLNLPDSPYNANDLQIKINGEYVNNGSVLSMTRDSSLLQQFFIVIEMQFPADFDYTGVVGSLTIKSVIAGTNETVTTGVNLYIEETYPNMTLFEKQAKMLSSDTESFMLLRTNPLLTGNIKIVVTENGNMYLDTFKVSKTSVLNKKQFRHKEISADGNYATDVYNVFRTLPQGEMYSLYPDSYNATKNYYDLNEQIENIYEYGAAFNNDELYSENMSLLAPIYIGKHVPDYFVIFKTERIQTTNYSQLNAELFSELLKTATIVKVFDLRRNTAFGKYLNNYQKQVDTYLSGVCSLQFIELDNEKGTENYRLGKNTWRGLVYDKGVYADKSETTYFASKILELAESQERYNMFLVNGFKRNNLLYPNILNIEFMFNDKDAEDFTMHNYFGLYLTENSFQTFNQIVSYKDNNNSVTEYYDENNVKVSDPFKLINDILTLDAYKDRVFFNSTPEIASNIKNTEDINTFILQNVINKPYDNIVQLSGRHIVFEEPEKSFLTVEFDSIKKGEHFRFIVEKSREYNLEKNIVLEIIASDDIRLKNMTGMVTPYVLSNTGLFGINNVYFEDDNTEFYRVAFYAMSDNDPVTEAPINILLQRIEAAVRMLDSFIYVSYVSDKSIAFMSNYANTFFQHILAEPYDNSTEKVTDTIHCHTHTDMFAYKLSNETDWYNIDSIMFALSGVELSGNRYCSITKFCNTDIYNSYWTYEVNADLYEDLRTQLYPLIAVKDNVKYAPLVKQTVKTFVLAKADLFELTSEKEQLDTYNTLMSPYDTNKSLVLSYYQSELINNMINICNPITYNLSVMGINGVKDINTYLELNETMTYKSESSITIPAGEKLYLDNQDIRLRNFVPYKFVSGYFKNLPLASDMVFMILGREIIYMDISAINASGNINGILSVIVQNNFIEVLADTVLSIDDTNMFQYNYVSTNPVLKEYNYYLNKDIMKKMYHAIVGEFSITSSEQVPALDIPFIPAVNAAWKSNGVYFDNNSILDTTNLKKNYNIHGNFIETVYNPAAYSNNQYLPMTLDDVCAKDFKTIKDYILQTGHIKKYLMCYTNMNTAIGSYNSNVQTLEFIYYGIRFILKLTSAKYINDIHLNEFNNYEVMVINSYDGTQNEMFVSTEEEFILIVNHNYQGHVSYMNEAVKIYGDVIANVNYDYFKAPYNYVMHDTMYIDNKFYFHKTDNKVLTSGDWFVETDSPTVFDMTISSNKAIYASISLDSSAFTSFDEYDMLANNNIMFGVYQNTCDSNFESFIGLYSDLSDIEGIVKNSYLVKETVEQSLSGKEQIEEYIKTLNTENTDLCMYIIYKNNPVDKICITNQYTPLYMTLSIPNTIKYNQGLFNIAFKDIFEFEHDDIIGGELDIDMLNANTQISYINTIPNYYQYKIMESGKYCKLNYFKSSNRNVLSTDWDINIYRLYSKDNSFKYQPGYMCGITDKMFFGSKCLVINNSEIVFDKWLDADAASYNETISSYGEKSQTMSEFNIVLNLTNMFIKKIASIDSFTSNWQNITDASQKESSLNNYIMRTLINYYDLNNVEIELYRKYDMNSVPVDEVLQLSEPDDFNEYIQYNNFKVHQEKVIDMNIVTLGVTEYSHYRYYPIVKIKRF